jgi:catechol 2,3-dioxygenase-like lactoylglutathione lyase family enzyme
MRRETVMSANEVSGSTPASKASAQADMKVEVLVISVSDIDRTKEFYLKLGCRLDVTPTGVVQFTPPGSWCSVQFGKSLTSAAPGSSEAYLIVADVVATRERLVASGIEVGEFFHSGPEGRAAVWIPSVPAIARAPLSATPTEMSGCCRKLRLGFPGALTQA